MSSTHHDLKKKENFYGLDTAPNDALVMTSTTCDLAQCGDDAAEPTLEHAEDLNVEKQLWGKRHLVGKVMSWGNCLTV